MHIFCKNLSKLLVKPEIKHFLDQQSLSTDAKQAAIADNCRFDERTGLARWNKLEKRLPNPLAPDWIDWSEAENLNYNDTVIVLRSSIPDSFLDLNQMAWLQGIATNRTVVRLEHLERLFNKEHLSFDIFQSLINSKDPDEKKRLETVMESWNNMRDGRPTFAAFYDEVKTEADHTDWQHQLRDRLGLGHYGSNKGVEIPVALMRYSLDEVVTAAKAKSIPCAFALPTVLDGGMHEFFFPVPKSHPYGATLHLVPNQADTLTAEMLHYRIDYRPEHLWKIAWIKRPHNITDDDCLREARDLHLIALQEAANRPDFGQAMEGR
jgi:hypothetical protein